jgi:ABC-type Fe3+ transport system permease subunit
MILTSLASPWVWPIAAAGTVVQGVTLAGPEALKRFRWLTANLLVLGSIVGGTALAVALSIALNHLGTDNLDDLTLGRAFFEIVLYSLLAVLLAVLCSLTTAALGDRLLRRNKGRKTSLILVLTCLLGLGIGGAIGLLLA